MKDSCLFIYSALVRLFERENGDENTFTSMKASSPITSNPALKVWLCALLPAIIGVLLAMLSIGAAGEYGFVVFYGLPFLISSVATYLYNRQGKTSFAKSYGIAFLSLMMTGVLGIVIALDGLICMLFALPLAAVVSLPGAAIGRAIASDLHRPNWDRSIVLLICCFPLLIAAEANLQHEPLVAPVTTAIEIDAPIQEVWKQVISFPPIMQPPGLLFKLGIAYPIKARIVGSGVGAVRYCEFSTGPFVEPVTAWEPPHLLAFTVTASPCPLKELSIYPDLDVPHLHGFLKSEHGEFRLHESNGKTVVMGTTWYANDMAPEFYWRAISDHIIHSVHERVLNHIKTVAEAQAKE